MNTGSTSTRLREISPDQIFRNRENPRLFFRSEEMNSLLASISRYGIQVPLTVFEEGKKFYLIDGERRWSCARKLNLKTVPVLVQPKPTDLNNLLLMFNIHALREQWDYITIAKKLPRVIELHKAQNNGKEPNEAELSELTGLTRGQIRRCKLLLDLPEKYLNLLLEEMKLPKAKQQLSEDFFIEMERALKSVANRVAHAARDMDRVREVLIAKYRRGTIENITDFRKLSKLATSIKSLGSDEGEIEVAIKSIFSPRGPGISEVFEQTIGLKYDEKKVIRQIDSLTAYLDSISEEELAELEDRGLLDSLARLKIELDRLFEGT